jgi:hypothetical protein
MPQYSEKDRRSVQVSLDQTSYPGKLSLAYKDGNEVCEISAGSLDSLIAQNLSNEKVSDAMGILREVVKRYDEFVENGKKGNFRFLIETFSCSKRA